jgi:V8-like Glu-specific endopeptidase
MRLTTTLCGLLDLKAARGRALAFALLALLVAPQQAGAQTVTLDPETEGATEAVDVKTPVFQPIEADGTTFWQFEFDRIGSRFLRLHFAAIKAPAGSSARLVISDRDGRIVDSYQGAALAAMSDSWSKVVTGGYALLSLVAEEQPVGVEISVDQIAFSTTEGESSSIIGADQLQDVDEFAHDPLVSVLARAVAKLTFIKNGRAYTCSGFMYAPDLLMTNEHCVNTPALCRDTMVIFQYQIENGTISNGTQFRCAALVDVNAELDYAILRVEGSPGIQWGTLTLSRADAAQDEPLIIVQHPGGRPKMVSRVDCLATQSVADGLAPESDLAHGCDTAGGSSGSPVLTLSGQVIGLHHFGVAEGAFWNQNRAIRMAKILDRIGQP